MRYLFACQVLMLIFTVSFTTQKTYGQDGYLKGYFRSPVDIPIQLSGTFGELRSDHFHAGIDIRTEGVEGKNIYAVADGYVSRIKISPYGYGKAIYITHPNGFVSVYGHLQRLNDEIGAYVRNEQFKNESWALNLFPRKNLLKVKKGDVIALSGNSGGSGGPHLHFEIRDEASQYPLNPLLYSIDVDDYIAPVIRLIRIYPEGPNSLVHYEDKPGSFLVKGWGKEHKVKADQPVPVTGKVSFGILTYDLFNNGANKNGVYSVDIYLDSVLHYSQVMKSFSFAETRYINSLIDYDYYTRMKSRVIRSRIDPNNQLGIYSNVLNNGIFEIDEGTSEVMFVVKDVKDNEAVLTLQLQHVDTAVESKPPVINPESRYSSFSYKKNNSFSTEKVELTVPQGALYDNLFFEYFSEPPLSNSVSEVHNLHYETVPIHLWCDLKIKADSISPSLTSKAVIARIDRDGDFSAARSRHENGFVKARIRDFGPYVVLIDTVAPVITPLNLSQGRKVGNQEKFLIRIRDELSGIDSYRGTLNGRWTIMEYDAKNDLLIYYFDELLKKGNNEFKLVVTDRSGNSSTYEAVVDNSRE